jgi:hypothetical protein
MTESSLKWNPIIAAVILVAAGVIIIHLQSHRPKSAFAFIHKRLSNDGNLRIISYHSLVYLFYSLVYCFLFLKFGDLSHLVLSLCFIMLFYLIPKSLSWGTFLYHVFVSEYGNLKDWRNLQSRSDRYRLYNDHLAEHDELRRDWFSKGCPILTLKQINKEFQNPKSKRDLRDLMLYAKRYNINLVKLRIELSQIQDEDLWIQRWSFWLKQRDYYRYKRWLNYLKSLWLPLSSSIMGIVIGLAWIIIEHRHDVLTLLTIGGSFTIVLVCLTVIYSCVIAIYRTFTIMGFRGNQGNKIIKPFEPLYDLVYVAVAWIAALGLVQTIGLSFVFSYASPNQWYLMPIALLALSSVILLPLATFRSMYVSFRLSKAVRYSDILNQIEQEGESIKLKSDLDDIRSQSDASSMIWRGVNWLITYALPLTLTIYQILNGGINE